MKEKEATRDFGRWVTANMGMWTARYGSCAIEAKMMRGDRIPTSALRPHQVDSLVTAKETGIWHKIADSPVSWLKDANVRGTLRKPFDGAIVKGNAYVVVYRYVPRQRVKDREFCVVEVGEWLLMTEAAERGGKRSVTWEEVKERGHVFRSFLTYLT